MYVCKHEEYPFVNKYEEYLSKEVCILSYGNVLH